MAERANTGRSASPERAGGAEDGEKERERSPEPAAAATAEEPKAVKEEDAPPAEEAKPDEAAAGEKDGGGAAADPEAAAAPNVLPAPKFSMEAGNITGGGASVPAGTWNSGKSKVEEPPPSKAQERLSDVDIANMLNTREEHRKVNQFMEADVIRERLRNAGVTCDDRTKMWISTGKLFKSKDICVRAELRMSCQTDARA